MTALQQPLARYERFSTTDVDEAREQVARVYCDHRLRPLSGARTVGAWQTMARTGAIAVGAMSYGADVEIEPGALDDFFLLMLPYSGQARIKQGRHEAEASSAQATVLNPDDATRMRWSADCAKLMVRIDRGALEQQLSAMLGGAPAKGVRFDLAMPVQGASAHWWRMVNLLMDGLELSEEPPNPLAASLQESLLMVSLLEHQANNFTARLAQRSNAIAPRHVRLVEGFIEENADKPLDLQDLIAVSGVSGRALFDGFRRFRGTSPLAHLRMVRLNRVREQLLTGGEEETVTSVATQWGFYQLGRFAALYKATFGESPSETRRRR